MQSVQGASDDKYDAGMPDKFKPPPKRLVSGGNDNAVNIWEFVDGQETPTRTKIGEHSDWVRDVAWCCNIGLLHEMIASCSEDCTAKVWKHISDKEGSKWVAKEVKIAEKVPNWKVSWSQVGNMLAVSGGDN